MSAKITLDSWAVLAWLQGEPAGATVRDLIAWAEGDEAASPRLKRLLRTPTKRPKLFINIVNLGEIFYVIGRRFGEAKAQETVDEIRASVITTVSASEELVLTAASFKIKYPIAYADAFALATAASQGSALLTGDPELRAIEEVPILWIGS